MLYSAIVTSAFMATSALASGSAHVVNQCGYPVHMQNTPASGGGQSNVDELLQTGDSYSQSWTELTNGMGWSIKLSENGNYQSNLMQYEYTFHNDGTIWYDMSEVDGNPWSGNWMITAEGANCSPRQAAYRHPTDDAYGMQSCSDSASITLTLCSGESSSGGDDDSSSASPSEAASTTADDMPAYTPSATSEATTVQTTEASQQTGGWQWGWNAEKGVVQAAAEPAENSPSPTTLMTQVATTNNYGATVTHYATEVVTAYVTEAARAKRHEHHPRHPRQQPREE